MNVFLKNSIAICLAVLVLFSTMSFTLSSHYCGDHLVSTSIFTKAKSCGMKMQQSSDIEACSMLKKNCCKDEIKLIQGQKDLKIDFYNINFQQQQYFITSFALTYLSLFKIEEPSFVPFINYSPPLVVKNIQKLDETYLI